MTASQPDPPLRRPSLAVTIGDAAGVGPELALRAAGLPEVLQTCLPRIFGDADCLARVGERLGMPVPTAVALEEFLTLPPAEAAGRWPEPIVVHTTAMSAGEVTPGTFSAATGLASYQTVCAAVDAALDTRVDGIVTGPIQKEAWRAAGIDYPGHTELLADRVGRAVDGRPCDVRMMLCSETIACVLETIHVPLADVPRMLNVDSLAHTIGLAGHSIRQMTRGRERTAGGPERQGSLLPPRIAVLGLNPHAGEHGLFSHGEEEAVVIPAIRRAREAGWDVVGPLPPDTAFTPQRRQQVDVYVCLYHDQGLIPLKAIAFDDAVNVTLGLPVIRTSVDHGTAMDLAWQGKAGHSSMIAAMRVAADAARWQ